MLSGRVVGQDSQGRRDGPRPARQRAVRGWVSGATSQQPTTHWPCATAGTLLHCVCQPSHLLLRAASLGSRVGAVGQVLRGNTRGVGERSQRPPGRLQPVRQAGPGRGRRERGPTAHRQQQLVNQRLRAKWEDAAQRELLLPASGGGRASAGSGVPLPVASSRLPNSDCWPMRRRDS